MPLSLLVTALLALLPLAFFLLRALLDPELIRPQRSRRPSG
jgi:hypothetical protein